MLSCIYFNARSIKNKLCDLHYVIYNDNAPEVVFICETWLNKSITNSMIDPLNVFNIYRCDRSNKGGGDVLALVNRRLKTVQIDDINIFSHIESVGFDIISDRTTIRFLSFYRPPGCTQEDNIIMTQICDCIKSCCGNNLITV